MCDSGKGQMLENLIKLKDMRFENFFKYSFFQHNWYSLQFLRTVGKIWFAYNKLKHLLISFDEFDDLEDESFILTVCRIILVLHQRGKISMVISIWMNRLERLKF